MKQKSASLAKVRRPHVAGVFPRKRLFAELDRLCSKPIIWVSGPPGCGKTTLVASYLDARDLPCLWYQLDEGDANPATFFYYMGLAAKQAAPRRRKPLPLLTPEYLPGLPTFALRYFEDVYDRLKPPAVLVFDNYQEVSPESPFHEVIRHALLHVPEDINVIVISRREPHPVLMRTRASQLMEIIGWDELRLTLEESKGIAHTVKTRKLSKDTIQQLHDTIEGWAAGLVLILRRAEVKGIDPQEIVKLSMGDIFDYFVGEAFEKMDAETQEFLLKTAFLRKMTAKMAAALTGLSSAGRILSKLNRNYYFTERRPHSPPSYEYHALFREFLLSRATETLAPESLSALRRNAATLLEEAGDTEEALMLFQEVGDWDMMIRSILTHAPSMLEQGRNLAMEKWLAGLPTEILEDTPWLLYWMGACKMPFDPGVSRQYFERAYEQFKIEEDVAGIFLAWSGVVEAILHSWEDWNLINEWIITLKEVMRNYDTFPSEEIEARVTSGMCGAILARPHHPDIEVWLERAMGLSENKRTITAKGMALHLAAQYYLMRGNLEKVVSALSSLELLTRSAYVKPLVKIALLLSESIYLWHIGSYDRCFKSLSNALELSQATGVHIYDHALLGNMACAALEAGDKAMAAESLEKMAMSLNQLMKYDKNFYYYLKAKQAFYEGNLKQASAHVETSSKLTAEFGFPFGLALTHLMKSQVLHELGKREDAKSCLVQARNIGREIKSEIIMLHVYLIEAQWAVAQGDEATALAALQNALTIGKETGYIFAQEPHVTARLLAKALEAGIEVEYAQDVIKKRNILLDKPPLHLENWPWPLKAFTLGRFTLVKDEKPIRFSKKAQQKPLSLLKALIAFGGRAVKEERIADALWPEADGDMAHQSLATTLHRLRTLIGYHEAVQLGDGRLTLDPRYCWVDVWAFERMLGQADVIWDKEPKERAAPEAVELTQKAINLYHGPFLGGETGDYWIISFREKLRSKFLRSIESLGAYHEGAEQWEYAGACYQRALEVDDLAEGCYRRLMVCHQKLGRRPEALAVYDRCKDALARGLGVEPSPETQAVCRALISE